MAPQLPQDWMFRRTLMWPISILGQVVWLSSLMTQRVWASYRLAVSNGLCGASWARRPVVRPAALGGLSIPPTDSEPNLQSSNTAVDTPVDRMHLTPRSNFQGRRFNTNSGATRYLLHTYGREAKTLRQGCRSAESLSLLSPSQSRCDAAVKQPTSAGNSAIPTSGLNWEVLGEAGALQKYILSFSLPFNKPRGLQPLSFCSSHRCLRLCRFLSVLVSSCSFTIHTTLPP